MTRVPSREVQVSALDVVRNRCLRFGVDVEQRSLFERVDCGFRERLILIEDPIVRVFLLEFVFEFAADIHLNDKR